MSSKDVLELVLENFNKFHVTLNEIQLSIKEIHKKINDDKLKEKFDELRTKVDVLNCTNLPSVYTSISAGAVNVVSDTVEKTKQTDGSVPTYFNVITEYFKYVFVNKQKELIDRNVVTEEEIRETTESVKTKDKKKSSEVLLQKQIALQIWKTRTQEQKNKVYALKNEHYSAYQKDNSKDISEEKEE